MKKAPLSEVKDDLPRYLRVAEKEEVVITRHGKPAGLLIGFRSGEDREQGRRAPSGAARTLLHVAEKHSHAVLDAA